MQGGGVLARVAVNSVLSEDLKIKKTFAFGCPLVVETLWERLGLKETLENIVKVSGTQVPYERALLAMNGSQPSL